MLIYMNPAMLFRQINTLYYSMLGGQVLFAVVAVFLLEHPQAFRSGWPAAPLGLVLPLVAVGALGAAFFINRKRLAEGSAESDLEAKLAHYRSTVIVRSALVEGMTLMSIVFFMLELNTTYLVFFGLGLLVFLYFRPSGDEFSRYYGLSAAEQSELRH
ncbi:MAG: hypothetical protein KDK34_03530 [Leptospiraceae bacterium]|nr:hypothetical protein [Leptospiraceae bacterium]